ncbi:hypothetical protein BZG36_00057 [Bifiguratus adelaidae]|uniref:Endonuclease/exonuclease/phosphatase domain-containing protein n=1 Tax=Bifiguratus adelaidae TaxID=1938954 RepID=A0A261Y8G5_9FUNG|nr:hypothetical protein BZG36_00057 [Bifiguratus adelaidae]
MDKHRLSVLTLNCWQFPHQQRLSIVLRGLNIVSRERQRRLAAIGDYIAACDADIVGLQEIWMWSDWEYIQRVASERFGHVQLYYSGTLGAGLGILSKYPIVSTHYHRYSQGGLPLKILHGDFYVGKGVACATIRHPAVLIDVYNTHLHAGYGPGLNRYEGHKFAEGWELARLLRQSIAAGHHTIALGDFNVTPTSHVYQLLTQHACMTDSWLDVHQANLPRGVDPANPAICTPEQAIDIFGITCDSPHNSWSKRTHLKQEPTNAELGDRLDYIFYFKSSLVCQDSRVVMTESIPNTTHSYSDHFGVQSTFTFSSSKPQPALTDPLDTRLTSLFLSEALDVIVYHQEAAMSQSLRYCVLCGISGILAITCYLASVVLVALLARLHHPTVVLPITTTVFGLCAMVLSATCIVMLVAGFVCGWNDDRCYRNVKAEMSRLSTLLSSSSNGSHTHTD